MMNAVIRHWNNKNRQLPGINCIVYPDGSVTLLNCYSLYDPNTNKTKFYCLPLCDTTIDSIEKYDAAYWTAVDPWTSIACRDGKIYGGDGSMGNQGFIACVDAQDHLLWGMFFENTNPIKALEIQDNHLIATNEHNELKIEVDLSCLTNIKITPI